jgi:hypothetical protein
MYLTSEVLLRILHIELVKWLALANCRRTALFPLLCSDATNPGLQCNMALLNPERAPSLSTHPGTVTAVPMIVLSVYYCPAAR